MSEELVEAIANMREADALKVVREMLEGGADATEVLVSCREAMTIVGERYQTGNYFLPELIMSGEMLKKIAELVKPKVVAASETKRLGRILIGTVRGDIHDIGKDIVTFMLDVNGFEVLDLGVDVPEEQFVKAIKEFQPQVVGLSGFLTLAFDTMKSTVAAIGTAGLRDEVKIMIGGGQINDMIRDYTGADAYGLDAMAAVTLAKQWMGVN
ncbi:MAG: cobalamin-dependent protein [Chloroflexi bacterium]|nr:cobalamin-dependent protein [Chloroflexota bacterium]